MANIDDIVAAAWREHVASAYAYRGMSASDLSDPLDPGSNPYADALPLLRTCLDILQRVVESGFEFTLVETHWGQTWEHDLRNIVAWSRNDFAHPRIDFASSLQAAREYSDNWQGSQLKQSMRYITEHLPEYRDDPLLRQTMCERDWALLERVNRWVNNGEDRHTGIVLWVRRSHPALRSRTACAPVGALPDFRDRLLKELERRRIPCSGAAVTELLPQEFDASLVEPLRRRDIERIEEVTGPGPRRCA